MRRTSWTWGTTAPALVAVLVGTAGCALLPPGSVPPPFGQPPPGSSTDCPKASSHPGPAAWYLTFHGSGTDPNVVPNNICAYDASGKPLPDPVLQTKGTKLTLEELRGMAFGSDGSLYVANANKDVSAIVHFGSPTGSSGTRVPVGDGVFSSSSASNPGLNHPYGLAFGPSGPSGELLASSQDSDVVTALTQPSGAPAPIAPAWANTKSPPGTLAPSAAQVSSGSGGLKGPRGIVTLPPAQQSGVKAPANANPGDGILYVADNADQAVKAYDATTGKYYGKVLDGTKESAVGDPVGLTIHAGLLYVTSEKTDDVVALDLGSGKTYLVAAKTTDNVTLQNPSGIAFGTDGRLYVNSRVGRQLIAYTLEHSGHDAAAASVFVPTSAFPNQDFELEQLAPVP